MQFCLNMSVLLDYRKHVASDNVVPDIKWS